MEHLPVIKDVLVYKTGTQIYLNFLTNRAIMRIVETAVMAKGQMEYCCSYCSLLYMVKLISGYQVDNINDHPSLIALHSMQKNLPPHIL